MREGTPTLASLWRRAEEIARRRPRRVIAGAGAVLVLIVALVLLVGSGGGGSNGLASSYSCSGATGYSLDFTSTGDATGHGLSGTATLSDGSTETFNEGQVENGTVGFGSIQDPSGEDPADLQEGAVLLTNGNLSFHDGAIVCSS